MKKIKSPLRQYSIAFILLGLSVSFVSNADTKQALHAQFNKAYYAYQASVKSNNSEAQFEHAKEAYLLGKQFYGDNDINTANLGLILAKQHLDHRGKSQANSLLVATLATFEREYGKDSAELAELFILLGQSLPSKSRKKATKYYLKAIAVAKKHQEEQPFFTAQIQLEAGIGLLKLRSEKSRVIIKAQEYFSKHLAKDDKRVVNANFHAGKYYLARNKYNKAISNWQDNLPVFEALSGATHPLELSTRAFLINALESTGQSEEATKHCIAIGSMTPWDDSQEQQPIFRSNPRYPKDYARRGKSGWVRIGFTISDFGTVKNAKVLKSKGGKLFEQSALAALDKWRYAPKFENGKPIQANATVQLDFKMR